MFGIAMGGCSCHCAQPYNILSLTANGDRRYTRYTQSNVCYYVHPHGNDLYSGSDLYSNAPKFGPVTGALQKWSGIDSEDGPTREWFSDFAGSPLDTGFFGEQIVGAGTIPTIADDHLIAVSDDGHVYAMGVSGAFVYRVVRYTPSGIPDKALRYPFSEAFRGGVHFAGSGIQAATAGVGGKVYDADLDLNVAGSYGSENGPLFFNVVLPVKIPGGWADLSTNITREITELLVMGNVNINYTGTTGAVSLDGSSLYVASLSHVNGDALLGKLIKLPLPTLGGSAYPHPGPDTFDWLVSHGMSASFGVFSNRVGVTSANDGSVWLYDRGKIRHFDAGGAITTTVSLTPFSVIAGIKGVRAIGDSDALVFGNFSGPDGMYNLVRVTPGSPDPVWAVPFGTGEETTPIMCFDAHVSAAGDVYACGSTITP